MLEAALCLDKQQQAAITIYAGLFSDKQVFHE
jgi:hypothetical protein